MDKEVLLDYVLVPSGLLVMVVYHIWLLYKVIKHPTATVIGINAVNRRYWVRAMMEDVEKNGVLAVQTLRNNIMASTLLASTAIMLSSLIAVLMTGGGVGGSHSFGLAYAGKSSELGFSVKFFSILVCFLVAFLLNVQSIRYYSHASILINVPYKKISPDYLLLHHHNHRNPHPGLTQHQRESATSDYVGWTVNRGSYFWSLGLRAFYFSFPLFLWIFGAIPMFMCCIVLVFLLYFLDFTSDFAWVAEVSDDSKADEETQLTIN